jgi:ribonucleoside-triphosphate reductase
VAINLPRIAYESEKDKAKFLELLRGRLELASRAFEIKYGALKQHGAGLLPFVMQSANGDRYFRIESSTRLLNLVGLEEALEVFFGRNPHRNEEALKMVDEVAQCVSDFVRRVGRKHGKRLLPAIMPDTEASERLAQLDIDRYGLGKTKFSGTREKPFYSTVVPLTVQDGQIPQDLLALEHRLRGLRAGGSLSVIEPEESEFKPDELLALTSKIIEVGGIEFFTYNRKLTYCTNCRKSWSGSHSKCPSCGAVGALMTYDRFASSRAQTG